jgi:hypothetical protein
MPWCWRNITCQGGSVKNKLLLILLLLLPLLFFITPLESDAQEGIYRRDDCTTITSPVAFKTFCFEQIGDAQGKIKVWNGTEWEFVFLEGVGSGSVVEITTANSLANAFCIGDGTDKICIYVAPDGPKGACLTNGIEDACDKNIVLAPGFTFRIKNSIGADIISVKEDGTLTGFSAGGGTNTQYREMRLDSVSNNNSNAQALPSFGTNLNYAAVRFVDGATGNSFWSTSIPKTSSSWNMILHSKPGSGDGTAVSLQIACNSIGNETLDVVGTFIHGASGNPAEITLSETSANMNITVIAATMPLTARDRLFCGVVRVGADVNDDLVAAWDLLGVSLEIN